MTKNSSGTVVLETLHRTTQVELSDLSDNELVQCAEELFLALDREDFWEIAYE